MDAAGIAWRVLGRRYAEPRQTLGGHIVRDSDLNVPTPLLDRSAGLVRTGTQVSAAGAQSGARSPLGLVACHEAVMARASAA